MDADAEAVTDPPTSSDSVAGPAVATDFSRRDQEVLAVLHQHLIARRATALRGVNRSTSAAGLTVREAEILTWAVRGESDAAIAARLGIAPRTVNKHLEHAYAALGVHSRPEAVGRIVFGGTDD